MGKISVIMPAYNSEKFIKKSINSVLNQTYKNIELIIINDGSTDSTERIIKNKLETESRIKYFKIDNSGSAVARNVGLDNASGDYIAFVDSDDYIESEMFETLINVAIEYSCDIVSCSYNQIFKDQIIPEKTYFDGGKYNKEDLENKIYPVIFTDNELKNKVPKSMWTKLYNRSMIIKNNIRFIPDLRMGQDIIFSITSYLHAESLYYLPEKKMYNYYYNQDSRTNTYLKNGWKILKNNTQQLKILSDKFPNYPLKSQLPFSLIQNAKTAIINVMLNNENNKRDKKEEMASIVSDKYLQYMLKRVDMNHFSLKNKLITKMIQKQNVNLLYLVSNYFVKRHFYM